MATKKVKRRGMLAGIAGLTGGFFLFQRVAASGRTPKAAEGPFYPQPSMRMEDVDNDLVKVAGLVRDAGGEVIILKGRVLTKAGDPLPDHRIEIWQCDMNGRYLHPGDDRAQEYDQGFQGFGHDITGADGAYRFRTIKPARYPGRTPHIHVKVFDGGRERLTTQFYVRGEPANARDGLFRRMTGEQAEAVLMTYAEGPEGTEAVVDVIL